jgi:Ca2+-binding RTX toxin-like protein
MSTFFSRDRNARKAGAASPAHSASAPRRPAIESLESRQLLHGGIGAGFGGCGGDAAALTAGANLSDRGVLAVVGDQTAANAISVSLSADGTNVVTNIGGAEKTFTAADVKRIAVVGGAANDSINVNLASTTFDARVSISGGGGDDQITAGAEDDQISGGAGNDVINAGDGENRVDGGDGDDRLTGGADEDYLSGGAGNDTLTGNAGDDKLDGGAGDDTITGGAGNDRLSAGDGTDNLSGGDGDDTLVGTAGTDTLDGGAGTNTTLEAGTRAAHGGHGHPVAARAIRAFFNFGRRR